MPPRALPAGGLIGPLNPNVDLSQETLQSSMAKIAVFQENQATAAADKSISTTPNWKRLSQQGQTIILRASTVDTFEPAPTPSEFYTGF